MRRSIVVSSASAIGALAILCAQDLAEGSLLWHVNRAKTNHQTVAHVPIPKQLFAEARDLPSASQKASIVIADVVDQITTYDTYHIYTWRKFRVRERLGQYQYTPISEGEPPQIPERLLPISSNEFVMLEPFGTIQLAGVTVSAEDSRLTPLPLSEPRLMFVQFRDGGTTAALVFGHKGVFSITPDGRLRANLDANSNELKKDLDARCEGRFDRLKELLR